jgi:hypothetical protein
LRLLGGLRALDAQAGVDFDLAAAHGHPGDDRRWTVEVGFLEKGRDTCHETRAQILENEKVPKQLDKLFGFK